MKKTAVLVYDQFCNFEISVALEILAMHDKSIDVFAKTKEIVKCEEGLKVLPDKNIYELDLDEYDNKEVDEILDTFDIQRSLSEKGSPYDNAVSEATNKILKTEFVYTEKFESLEELKLKLAEYVYWYNNIRIHSSVGYKTPVEYKMKEDYR